MKHPSSRELHDYWNRARRGLPAAPRTAIEPADIRTILADTFILEVGALRSYRFRLAGTRLCGLYGRELKGTNFLDMWGGDDRRQVAGLLDAVSNEAAGVVAGVTGRAGADRVVPMELLLLPLVQHGPNYDRVLGLLAPMELPYWLALDPIVEQAIGSVRLIWTDESAVVTLAQPAKSQVAETRLPAARRDRFVVLEGGKSDG